LVYGARMAAHCGRQSCKSAHPRIIREIAYPGKFRKKINFLQISKMEDRKSNVRKFEKNKNQILENYKNKNQNLENFLKK